MTTNGPMKVEQPLAGLYSNGDTIMNVTYSHAGNWYALRTTRIEGGVSGWEYVGQDVEVPRTPMPFDEVCRILVPALHASETESPTQTIHRLIDMMSGSLYVRWGWSLAGTDCSGLASMAANIAAGLDAFGGGRIAVEDMAKQLWARGFIPGRGWFGDLTIAWITKEEAQEIRPDSDQHCMIILPSGAGASSGEGGAPSGVKWLNRSNWRFSHYMHKSIGQTGRQSCR